MAEERVESEYLCSIRMYPNQPVWHDFILPIFKVTIHREGAATN